MAMEYLRGLDLHALAEANRAALPWAAAAFIASEAARGLHAVHSVRTADAPSGLVHRDLSPSNVIACVDGAVKLVDFGLARAAGREQSRSGIEGKLGYLAPESVAGMAPDPLSDVYSLGVVLFRNAHAAAPVSRRERSRHHQPGDAETGPAAIEHRAGDTQGAR
jgi:serine/threonine protein kinase